MLDKKDSIRQIIYNKPKLKSILTLIIYIGLMVVMAILFSKYIDRDALQEIVENSGSLGVIVYFFIEVLYVTFTPLLNTVILIASGYLFGGHIGFIINFLATTVGLFAIVFLVKRYGRPLLQKVLSPNFYNRFDRLAQKVGPITLLICYVLPFTPDDELTYIVAAGPIPFKRFILPIVLGTLAKSAFSYIGDLGASGITIATYARLSMLILGLILVGAQEYYFKRKSVII